MTKKTPNPISTLAFSMKTPFILSNILMIIAYLVIIQYIRNLEATGCECSQDWRRTYIFWYIAISAIYIILQTLTFAVDYPLLKTIVSIYGMIPLIWLVATVIFVVFTLQYVNRLKKEKCACSMAAGQNVLRIVAWLHIFIWGFILFSVIFSAIVMSVVMKGV